jgi:hypothetical protein
MKTLLLDTAAWDLVLDAYGNIALADDPYRIAQDVATAVRTFAGECWYDNTLGVPYFSEILGEWPPAALIKSLIEQEASKVEGVAQATCLITGFSGRAVTGQIQITDTSGSTQSVSF